MLILTFNEKGYFGCVLSFCLFFSQENVINYQNYFFFFFALFYDQSFDSDSISKGETTNTIKDGYFSWLEEKYTFAREKFI